MPAHTLGAISSKIIQTGTLVSWHIWGLQVDKELLAAKHLHVSFFSFFIHSAKYIFQISLLPSNPNPSPFSKWFSFLLYREWQKPQRETTSILCICAYSSSFFLFIRRYQLPRANASCSALDPSTVASFCLSPLSFSYIIFFSCSVIHPKTT